MRRLGAYLVLLYVATASLPLGLVAWHGEPVGGLIFELGRSAALVGFALLVLQGVLAARIPWIERPFGLDVLLRFHRHMASLAVVLLVAHPVLIGLGSHDLSLLFSVDVTWPIWAGRAALLLLLANVAGSVRRHSLGLSFERWRLLHGLAGLSLLALVISHSWAIGGDLESRSLQALWVAAGAVGVALFAHHRLLRPWLLRRHAYRVADVKQEGAQVWTIVLEPPEGRAIPAFEPGQFHFVTLHRDRGQADEEHHFTISSSPTEKEHVCSTIKELGDFTATIKHTKVGDTATLDGPFGRFSYRLHPEDQDLVFIAGGIGITPLMSMLRCMRDSGDSRSVLLLYANRDENSIVFRDELAAMERGDAPRLEVVHVLSKPGPDWRGRRGRIDWEVIEAYLSKTTTERAFYVCGPPGLTASVIAALRELGVPDKRIRQEIFAFVD